MKSVYRQFLFVLVAIGTAIAAEETAAQEETPQETIVSHGLSAFGDLKYPADFEHFDYVNPEAPKGGSLSTTPVTLPVSTFDSFNAYILKGDPAAGLGFLFESLMTGAGDEADASYGLVAYEAELSVDRTWVKFRMRPEARFHDGSQIEAKDVVFSFNVLKEKGHPAIRQNLRDIESAEALSSHEVLFTFAPDIQTRDLPLTVAGLPIFSRNYYATREFDESTLEPPLGSGPYKIDDFQQGRNIEFVRVEDYWAKDLPVNVGRWNFDKIRFEYYRDRSISFQAFTANEYDFREEFTSRVWSTQYDFPAINEGLVAKRSIPDENPSGVQGYFFNTRRPQLADVRVREALDLAHDFEWTNKAIFYGLYDRTVSFFQGSRVLAAEGPPTNGELRLLEEFRESLPPTVFERAYIPPKTDGSGRNRENLRKARQLLEQAGWEVEDGRLVNQLGQPFEIEFLTFQPSSERMIAPFIQNLKLLGIDGSIRMVDAAQYERRTEDFEFDVTTTRYVQRNTPGVELRNAYSSTSADIPGTRNLAGIKDPIVDSLIESIVAAKSRDEHTSAVRALDRVLREGHYWVPQWNKAAHHIAYWNKFAWPDIKPKYDRGVIDTWWSKEAEANGGEAQ